MSIFDKVTASIAAMTSSLLIKTAFSITGKRQKRGIKAHLSVTLS
jgi:hypothetical protein